MDWLVPVLRMAEMDSRVLSLVVKLSPCRKMAFLYQLGLHTPNTLCVKPFRLDWSVTHRCRKTRMSSGSQQERPGLPDASQQPVAACLLLHRGWRAGWQGP